MFTHYRASVLLLCLITAASMAILFRGGAQLDAFTAYFAVLLVFISVTAWRDRSPGRGSPSSGATVLRDLAVSSLVFGAALAIRLHGLDRYSVWTDEETQSLLWTTPPFSVVRLAADHGQPPLGYYFTSLNLTLLGPTEWGIRLQAALAGSFAAVAFGWLLLRLSRAWIPAAIGTAAFILQPWLIRYSQEGRASALAILVQQLWLMGCVRFLASGGSWSSALSLAGVALLYLLAITFQPLIACAAVCAALIPFLNLKVARPKLLRFGLAHALALLLFLPLLLLAIRQDTQYLPAGSLERLWQGLQSLRLYRLLRLPKRLLEDQFLSVTALLAVGALMAHSARLGWRQVPIGRIRRRFTVALLSAMFFTLLFNFLYFTAVARAVLARYYLSLLPLLLLAACLAGAALLKVARSRSRRAVLVFTVIGVALSLIPSVTAVQSAFDRPPLHERFNADWRSAYEFLRQNGREGDVAYFFPIVRPGQWEQDGFFASQFYYRGDKPRPVRLQSRWDEQARPVSRAVLTDLRSGARPDSIFLVLNQDFGNCHSALRKVLFGIPRVQIRLLTWLCIAQVPAQGEIAAPLATALHRLVTRLKHNPWMFRILDLLARLAESRQDRMAALYYLNRLEGQRSRTNPIPSIIDYHRKCLQQVDLKCP